MRNWEIREVEGRTATRRKRGQKNRAGVKEGRREEEQRCGKEREERRRGKRGEKEAF